MVASCQSEKDVSMNSGLSVKQFGFESSAQCFRISANNRLWCGYASNLWHFPNYTLSTLLSGNVPYNQMFLFMFSSLPAPQISTDNDELTGDCCRLSVYQCISVLGQGFSSASIFWFLKHSIIGICGCIVLGCEGFWAL